MRGDQLARKWRVIRAVEASPNGLTVAEIANREKAGIQAPCRNPYVLQARPFSRYTEKVGRASRCGLFIFNFEDPPFILPIVTSILVAVINRFKAGNKWILLRSAAEAIKREIYRYRGRVEIHNNPQPPQKTPEAELARRIEDTSRPWGQMFKSLI
jgi:hypothetical protein